MSDDMMLRARAYGTLVDAHRSPRDGSDNPSSERAKQAAGVALFGNEALARLTPCAVCGALGDPGDDCGRRPEGHTLTLDNGEIETGRSWKP